mgnify:CR=1 FL=1
MGIGLYEAAFATVVRLYGAAAKDTITGITLLGGLASTVGWPLTAWLLTLMDWRNIAFLYAAMQIVIVLPIYAAIPRYRRAAAPAAAPTAAPGTPTATSPSYASTPMGPSSSMRRRTRAARSGPRRALFSFEGMR